MHSYTLSATHDGHTSYQIFLADNDDDATFAGIKRVLDRAIDDEAWAKGKIELHCKGRLVREMPAKQ